MELELVKWLLLGVMLCVQIHGNRGCFEEERLALLELKASFEVSDYHRLPPSWVDNPNSNCCKWERVRCNSSTGHVIELSLNRTWTYKIFEPFDCSEVLFLNVYMVQQFKELRSLDLSFNHIGGTGEDFEKLSDLKNLEILDLGNNCFNNTIMKSVGNLTSLKTLIVRINNMGGSFPSKEVGRLENLEILDLDGNSLNSIASIQDFKSLPQMRKLKYLSLSYNGFSNDIFTFFSVFPSIKGLALASNDLEAGPLLYQGLCDLKKLEELDLSSNYLGGILPPCLQNLTALRILDLSGNQFKGQITSSWLSSFKFLQYIDLSNNLFEGSFSFKEFANHSSLEVVQFVSDNNKFEVVTEYPNWVPSFQLQALVLQSCGLVTIPEFIFHQSRLRLVDLSHNKIKGGLPNWLVKNNTGLETLNLRNNSLIGQIHLPTNIPWLDVSDNGFSGQLEESSGKTIPNFEFLNLSSNYFQGVFPFSLGEDCKLKSLDLSFNNFTGEIPETLVSSCISLHNLKLSHNNFHGQILTSRFNLTRIRQLALNDNKLVGNLSSVVTEFDELVVLDISNNSFSGEIPRWMRNLTYLDFLVLNDNIFQGQIYCELLSNYYVDLSYNSFSGALPSCFSRLKSGFINLEGNRFSGSISELFLNSSYSLLTLNLRDNNLSGSISSRLGEFPNLRALSLSGNSLNGSIANWLCKLKELSLLDLSRNSFSGSIPRCLYNLSFGSKSDYSDQWAYRRIDSGGSVLLHSGSPLRIGDVYVTYDPSIHIKHVIEFVTKHMSLLYEGSILSYMSGLDLSNNEITGEIPDELGKLSQIRALNLSHNQLIGSIPKTFSNFSEIESLDLSYNNLSGQIPSELVELNFLEVFSVAHNNLSGRTPDRKGQFNTFENNSYEGNPFLCGPPLDDCSSDDDDSAISPMASPPAGVIDRVALLASFSVSFVMFFLGVITVLYVNPYWRQRLFNCSKEFLFSCYYFMYNNLFKYVVRLYR